MKPVRNINLRTNCLNHAPYLDNTHLSWYWVCDVDDWVLHQLVLQRSDHVHDILLLRFLLSGKSPLILTAVEYMSNIQTHKYQVLTADSCTQCCSVRSSFHIQLPVSVKLKNKSKLLLKDQYGPKKVFLFLLKI